MLYFRCPSCQSLLADKQLPYENELLTNSEMKKLLKELDALHDKLPLAKDDEAIIKIETEIAKATAKLDDCNKKIIDSLGLKRICCRKNLISYVPLIRLIK